MNSTIKTTYERPRALSPITKSKEKFSGKLIVLDNEKPIQDSQEVRCENERKKINNRPSSGSLEVIKPDGAAMPMSTEESEYSNQILRPSSGREQKKLPEVKRKIDHKCTCKKDSKICSACHTIEKQMKELHIDGSKIHPEKLMVSECKADRAPTNKNPFNVNSNEVEESNPNAEEVDSDTTSDDESENDQQGNGNDPNSQSTETVGASKAPLELLGMFLSAIMEKDYEKAQNLCDQILELEPENEICLQFRSTLKEKLDQDVEEMDSESDDTNSDDEEESDDENSNEDSGSSDNDTPSDNEADDELDKDIDVSKLNLLMGGVPVRKDKAL